MSIAVSVVVQPSRWLLATVAVMCCALAVVGVLIAGAFVGELALPLRLALGIACIFLAFFGFYHTGRNRKAHHIDISGIGQIRLSQAGTSTDPCQELNWPHLDSLRESGEPVRLLKGSTIWPHLLLLHLQATDGKITIVPILPDCVSRHEFRALSAACRWNATQNGSEHEKS